MNIRINNIDYTLKYTIRALFIFEQITNKTFEIKNVTDTYIFLYSIILANNADCTLTFTDLINACDEDNTIMQQFNEFLITNSEKNKLFNSNDNDDDVSKKKD